jgi:hypothetical protein
VATLVDAPKGQVGRPSRSLTLDQSLALLEAARESRLNAYVVLSLCMGIRTEEARELHWDHVDLDGDPSAVRPVPPSVAVWHSVRQGGDTTATTELVYRHELRPVITTGAEVMDRILNMRG